MPAAGLMSGGECVPQVNVRNIFRAGETGRPVTDRSGRFLPAMVVAFALFICLALAATEVWRETGARAAALEDAERATANLAKSLAQHAEGTFDVIDTALIGLVERLEAREAPGTALASVETVIRTWAANVPRLRTLTVLDAGGRILATSSMRGRIGEDRSDRDYFKHHRDVRNRAAHLGQPRQARSDGTWVVTLSRRIEHADGTLAGIVSAGVELGAIADFYAQFALGKTGSIALVEKDGTLLTRYPFVPELVGQKVPGAGSFTGQLDTRPSGSFGYTSPLDGMARLCGYQVTDSLPLVVVAAVGREEALGEWRRQALWRVGAEVPILLLVAGGGLGLAHQIRRGHRSEFARREAESRFRLMAENSSDLLCRIDARGIRTYVSPASERLLGFRPDEMVGCYVLDRIVPEDRPRMKAVMRDLRAGMQEAKITYRTRQKNGAEIWLETSVRIMIDSETGETDGVVTISRDVTERERLEGQLAALARTDSLTGLANRRSFDETLAAELHRARRTGAPLSLVLMDVDRFKRFNDTYGHLAGDECLQLVAGAIRTAAARPGDLVARYGGEEIALLLPGTDGLAAYAIAEAARRAVQDLARVHETNAPFGVVTASGGVVSYRPGGSGGISAAELVEGADQALYTAKQDGRNRVIAAPSLGDARPGARQAA